MAENEKPEFRAGKNVTVASIVRHVVSALRGSASGDEPPHASNGRRYLVERCLTQLEGGDTLQPLG